MGRWGTRGRNIVQSQKYLLIKVKLYPILYYWKGPLSNNVLKMYIEMIEPLNCSDEWRSNWAETLLQKQQKFSSFQIHKQDLKKRFFKRLILVQLTLSNASVKILIQTFRIRNWLARILLLPVGDVPLGSPVVKPRNDLKLKSDLLLTRALLWVGSKDRTANVRK